MPTTMVATIRPTVEIHQVVAMVDFSVCSVSNFALYSRVP